MVHPQPSTNTHSDNPTELGISNNTNKGQLLRVIKMKYFWILNKVQTSILRWSEVRYKKTYQITLPNSIQIVTPKRSVTIMNIHDFFWYMVQTLTTNSLGGYFDTPLWNHVSYQVNYPLPRTRNRLNNVGS